jgi:hypothetical protein
VTTPERPRRSWRRTALVVALAGLAVAVAGVPLGVLWHFAAPTVPVVDAGGNGFVVNDPSPEEYIAADGWFTLIGFAFGLVVAVVGWLVLRRHRGPGLLFALTVGALAAAPVAWYAGREIGRSAYEQWRAVAATGATYAAPPDLHAKGALLVPAFAAVIALTLLAGWSNDPDLERPGAKPGYGSQLQHQPDQDEPDYLSSGVPDEFGSGVPGEFGSGVPGEFGSGVPGEFASGVPDELSSGLPDEPDPTAAPAPHAPGQAGPPRG